MGDNAAGMAAGCRVCGRIAMRLSKNTEGVRQGYGCANGLAALRNAIANVDLYLTSSWLNTMR